MGREHGVAVQLRNCRNVRKEVNGEDLGYQGQMEKDQSNLQLRKIFSNLDSVEN